MKKNTISFKLSLTYLTIIISAIISGFFCLKSVYYYQELDAEISTKNIPCINLLKEGITVSNEIEYLLNQPVKNKEVTSKNELLTFINTKFYDFSEELAFSEKYCTSENEKSFIKKSNTINKSLIKLVNTAFNNSKTLDVKKLKKLSSQNIKSLKKQLSHKENRQKKIVLLKESVLEQLTYIIYFAILSILVISISSIYFTRKVISLPLERIKKHIYELSNGKINQLKFIDRNDEISNIKKSLNHLIQGLNIKTVFAKNIIENNFESKLKLDSEYDVLGQSLNSMAENMKTYSENIQRISNLQESIFNSTKQAIISTDKEGTIILFNKAAEKMLGYSSEEVVHKTSPAIFHDLEEVGNYAETLTKELGYEVQPGFKVFIEKAIKNGSDSHDWTYIRKDGSKLFVNLITSPVVDVNNEIIAYTGVVTDITQSVKDTNEIELLKKVIDEIAIFSVADHQGRIIEVNNKFLEISGFNRKDLIGQNHSILNSNHHSKEFFIQLWQKIANGEIWNGEIKNKKRDEGFYWVNTTIVPIKDPFTKKFKFISLRFDITQKKEIELELIKEKEQVEKLALAKDEFLSSMSHEIRTPLNGILGFTEILLQDEKINDIQLKQLKAIKTSGDILLVIINDILDIAKVESGNMSIESIPLNIYEHIPIILGTFSTKINEKKINLEFSIEDDIPEIILGDSVRISQIIINLASNAIKFTPEGGEIKLHLSSEVKENKDYLKFTLSDSGIGIPENKLDLIFQPFIQTEEDTARKYGGTGLGLTIVNKIVRLMDGEIKVTSKVNKGSTFTVLIPLIKEENTYEQKELTSKSETVILDQKKTIKKHVLIVEDNSINQLLAQTVLNAIGYTFVTVENGKLAYDIIRTKKEKFDIILMDIMMPVMDGYEASILIRALEDEELRIIPIIALTADVTPTVKEKCKKIGINAYISKPFDSNELNKTIQINLRS